MFVFINDSYPPLRHLLSFPTRRSSDLPRRAGGPPAGDRDNGSRRRLRRGHRGGLLGGAGRRRRALGGGQTVGADHGRGGARAAVPQLAKGGHPDIRLGRLRRLVNPVSDRPVKRMPPAGAPGQELSPVTAARLTRTAARLTRTQAPRMLVNIRAFALPISAYGVDDGCSNAESAA